jgi:hypothetical protein
MRERLEQLCREAAEQNKEMAEEAKLIAEDETKRRKEMEGKFQSTLDEINEK